MDANDVEIPADLDAYIEDQICMRIPLSNCWYEKKLGDTIAKTAHTFGRMVDRGAHAIGLKSQVEKKLQGCTTCGS